MTTRPTHFPIRFSEFDTGTLRGVSWMRFDETDYDVIEQRAALHARITGREIDIETGSVMPSGAVGSWDRIGIRVQP